MSMDSGMFLDGPISGMVPLGAATVMVRAAVGSSGEARPMSGTEDAAADEAVRVYIAVSMSSGFWDGRDPKTGRRTGGMMRTGYYRLLRPDLCPPSGAERDGASWMKWCDENRDALLAECKRLAAMEDRSSLRGGIE